MKQVLLVGGGEVSVQDVPIPTCDRRGILVRVAASAISTGTESTSVATGGSLIAKAARNPDLVRRVLDKARTQGWRRTVDQVRHRIETFTPTGYSAAGVVVEAGPDATGFHPGDRVACAGAEIANHAEYIAVPVNLAVRVPSEVPLEHGSFTTLGAIAMQGVRRANVELGHLILVVGLGLIGQITVQLLRAAGCRVIGADVRPDRVELARRLGMEEGVCLTSGDLIEAVGRFTKGHGVDAALITAATPSSGPVNTAMQVCRERGRVIILGAVGMNLHRDPMYRRELDVAISRSYGPGRYDNSYELRGQDYPYGHVRWTENRNMQAFVDLVAAGRMQVEPLISARFPVTEAAAAYAALKTPGRQTLGVILTYGDQEAAAVPSMIRVPERRIALHGELSPAGRVRLGLIGAGSYARGVHVPNIRNSQTLHLQAVATRSGHTARQVAAQARAAYATTDYMEVLADPNIDAVLIATRHHLHKEITIAALAAGKHVFVEKPMGLTVEDCEEIVKAVESSGLLLSVGFNRRMSRYSQQARAALAEVPGPKTVVYRVNAGTLPTDHWTGDPIEGGGRIVGEGVHFFDLMGWLVGADPVSVTAFHSSVGNPPTLQTDDIGATVSFADGSLGQLLYTTYGSPNAPKERVEAFAGGRTVIIDDFQELQVYGTAGSSKRRQMDKGQAALLENFGQAILQKGQLAVTARDGLIATKCALAALRSAEEAHECTNSVRI